MRLMMVDKVKEMKEDSIETEKFLTVNEEVFETHFPGNPVVPAAFMVEGAIQSARIFLWNKTQLNKTLLAYEFDKFKYKNLLCPGTILEIKVTFKDIEGLEEEKEILKVKAEGYSEGKEIFSGEMLCKVLPIETIHNVENCKMFLDYLLKDKK